MPEHYCTWISGGNECSESETIEPREEGEVWKDLNEAEHDTTNNKSRDGCANKRQGLQVHRTSLRKQRILLKLKDTLKSLSIS